MPLLDPAPIFRRTIAARFRARGLCWLATRACHASVERREQTWALRLLARYDRAERQEDLAVMRYARRARRLT